MKLEKSFVSRIRWGSVITAIILLFIIYQGLKAVPSRGFTSSGISLIVRADPDKISPGGESTLEIEVKNKDGEKAKMMVFSAKTFDDYLKFDDSWDREYVAPAFNIGPQESRKFTLKLTAGQSAVEGEYTVEVTATNLDDKNTEPTKDRAKIRIEDKN